MKSIALALLGACIAAPCLAQSAPASAPPPGKSMELSRVVLDTETNPIRARVKGGTLCVFPSRVDMPKEKKTQDEERYDSLFTTEMTGRGFTVVSSAGDLFAAESGVRGDFLVGATVEPTEMNICSSVSGFKGTVEIKVEWQIYDRAAQRVVERVETTGQSTLAAFSQSGYDEMFNLAFVSALQALVEQDVFEKYVGEPGPVQAVNGVPPPVTSPATTGN